jgi:lipopolysaccharide transport system ATP-binding protein
MHIDTPVKRYSSGQTVRLGFAVAAHLEPEILVVDEVLAVGDVEFQKRCIGKMKDVAGSGRTVLFVSHQMGAVVDLCSRCLWIDGGKVRDDGDADRIVGEYLRYWQGSAGEQIELVSVDKKLVINHIYALDESGNSRSTFRSGETMVVDIHYTARETIERPDFHICVQSKSGVTLSAHMLVDGHHPEKLKGSGSFQLIIPNLPLVPHQDYTLRIEVWSKDRRHLIKPADALGFRTRGELKEYGLEGQASHASLAKIPPVMVPYTWRLPEGTEKHFPGFKLSEKAALEEWPASQG